MKDRYTWQEDSRPLSLPLLREEGWSYDKEQDIYLPPGDQIIFVKMVGTKLFCPNVDKDEILLVVHTWGQLFHQIQRRKAIADRANYLKKIAPKAVESCKDLTVGSIVARHVIQPSFYGHIEISYVQQTYWDCMPPFTPHWTACFLGCHIGINVREGKPNHYFIHEPFNDHRLTWYSDIEPGEMSLSNKEPIYHVEDPEILELAKLIPKFSLPNLSFLLQTTFEEQDPKQKLVKVVEENADDIQIIREAVNRIRSRKSQV